LNETEITLKQMEANPASEFGEVLDRIKKLQILKAEMDINQKKLTSLQESIQDLDGNSSSSEYASILEKIENLQDRWEAVGQIMEVQSQRVIQYLRILHFKKEYILFLNSNLYYIAY